jgi:Uma2 family endonuclease
MAMPPPGRYDRLMKAKERAPATYADLLQVPDHLVAEIVEGELIATPRPAARHAHAASAVAGELFGPFHRRPGTPGGPGGWWILFEPELHLGPDVLVPDLAGWRQERMPVVPDVAFFEQPPDWVCEILSPRTERLDRRHKVALYARAEVGHLWLVNPVAKTLEIYRREGPHWLLLVTHAEDERVRAEPFDAVELELARWWLPEEA